MAGNEGSQEQQQPAASSFGAPVPSMGRDYGTPAAGGFSFGGAPAPAPAAGGLFGTPPAPAFGASVGGSGVGASPAPAPIGGGLFGAPAAAPVGGGLFGAPAPAPRHGLFGAPAAAPVEGGLFGAPAAAPSGGPEPSSNSFEQMRKLKNLDLQIMYDGEMSIKSRSLEEIDVTASNLRLKVTECICPSLQNFRVGYDVGLNIGVQLAPSRDISIDNSKQDSPLSEWDFVGIEAPRSCVVKAVVERLIIAYVHIFYYVYRNDV